MAGPSRPPKSKLVVVKGEPSNESPTRAAQPPIPPVSRPAKSEPTDLKGKGKEDPISDHNDPIQPPLPTKPETLQSQGKQKIVTDRFTVTPEQRIALEGQRKLITLCTIDGQHSMQVEVVWRNGRDGQHSVFNDQECYAFLKRWAKAMVMKSNIHLHVLMTHPPRSDNARHILSDIDILRRILLEDIQTVYAVLYKSSNGGLFKGNFFI